MPYDSTKDPRAAAIREKHDFGRKSRAVTPNDSTDIDPYARVVCVSTGNISVIPVENADGVPVPFLAVAAGFVVPFQVRRVMSTGTTATVYTVDS
jgi:hypothetical protein